MKIFLRTVFALSFFSAEARPDCKRAKFFDPVSGVEIAVSKEELKSGKKKLETISYIEANFSSKNIRLYANGDIKNSSGKKYGTIKGLGEFNWARAYEFNNSLVLQLGHDDGVDINTSDLYLLAANTFALVSRFQLPCMHNDEKIFLFKNQLTYACRYEVEKSEGLIHSYSAKEKLWIELQSSKNWDSIEKVKDLNEIEVKKVMKFWKTVELSHFDKRCE